MKQNYLNAFYSKLVLEKDYVPLQTEEGEFLIRPELKVLALIMRQRHQILEIIDGDAFGPDFLVERLKFSYDRNAPATDDADAPKVTRQIYIAVYENGPAPESEARLRELFKAPSFQTMVPERDLLTVNLAERTVAVFGWKPGVYGENAILHGLFKTDLEPYRDLPVYDELLAEKRREYTIEIQTARPTVTHILIGVNIAAWLFLSFLSWYYHWPYDGLLALCGAKINASIIAGEYWRLLTPMFLHAGNPIHVFVNCYSLYVLGNVMEKIYGHGKFALIYFAAGIIGNIGSFAFSPEAAVGASGAIFGLFGALLYFGVEQPKQFQKYFKSGVITTLILNGILWIFIAGLDNYAHLGGLGGGFLAAGACGVHAGAPGLKRRRYLMALLAAAIAVFGLYRGFH